MTGTSLDGVDAALVQIEGAGLAMSARVMGHATATLPAVGLLGRLAGDEPVRASEIAAAARSLAEAHVGAIEALLPLLPPDSGPELIALHGQTVFHRPPLSWQLVNPWPVAQRFGVPVVTDLRGADLAAGGQGAPITPLADWVLLGSRDASRCVVNLGGFANVTVLPAGGAEGVRGFDVCACNHVLNAVARARLGEAFDRDGVAAGLGRAEPSAVERLAGALVNRRARSLGSGDEQGAVAVAVTGALGPQDACATAAEAVALTIAAALPGCGRVIVAGGSARHGTLVRRLGALSGRAVSVSDELGVPAQAREAACMAVLGALAKDRVPITLPAVTGRGRACLDGAWVVP
jgi:1,6-anhydro-N-acetylmuramate kinase